MRAGSRGAGQRLLRLLIAAVALVAAPRPTTARAAFLEVTAYDTNTGARLGHGSYQFEWPGTREFEATTTLHQHIVTETPACAGTSDMAVPLRLRGRHEDGELHLVETWEAYTIHSDVVCHGQPRQISLPVPGGSRELRVRLEEGAEVDVVPPPPMHARLHYKLYLSGAPVPLAVVKKCKEVGIPKMKSMLVACPRTKELWQNAEAAAGGQGLSVACHTAGGHTTWGDDGAGRTEVRLRFDRSGCGLISELVQELSNAAHRKQIVEARAAIGRGELGREAYVDRIERIEFVGVRLRVTAMDECSPQWNCPPGDLAPWQKATSFEKYYKGLKAANPEHSKEIADSWEKFLAKR